MVTSRQRIRLYRVSWWCETPQPLPEHSHNQKELCMLIGWNGETLPALSLDKELEVAAAAGYSGVELFVPKLAPYLESHAVADLARHSQDTGLVPLTMNGIENINFRPPEEFIKVKVETLLWAYW